MTARHRRRPAGAQPAGCRPRIARLSGKDLARVLMSMSLAVCAALAGLGPAPHSGAAAKAPAAQVHDMVAHMLAAEPLRFEANRGQAPREVAFLARGHGYIAYLTPAGIALSLRSTPHETSPGLDSISTQSAMVWLRFMGAAHHPTVSGSHRLPGISNYFLGNDPRRWHARVPAFAQVAYHGLYPGIDAVFYDAGQGLEYDLRVAPGADPAAIRLAVTGGQMRLRAGTIAIHTEAGDIRLGAPHIYQIAAGRRQAVRGGYRTARGGAIAFRLAGYDHARPLVIDPSLSYSILLGGSGDDMGNGIAVDARGQAFITGQTGSLDFPSATHGVQSAYGGGRRCTDYYTCGDAFVAKLSADGRTLLYRTYLGGSGNDGAWTIAVDAHGNAYVEGRTLSPDFPTRHAFQPRLARGGANDGDAFVAKLSANGDTLLYSTYLGGTGNDQALGIAVDGLGQAFVTGYTSSRDFPLAHAFQNKNRAASGSVTAFVCKLSADGHALLYGTYLGGSNYESAGAIAVDRLGDAYVTGSTQSRDFPLARTLRHFSGGDHLDAFVSELNAGGSALLFSSYLGGAGETIGTSIALDGKRQIYVAGSTTAKDFPTRRAVQRAFGGGGALGWGDAFITKLSTGGNSIIVSTFLGGKGDEQALGLALDGHDDVFVAGATSSGNFPILHPIQAGNHTARSCKERLPYLPARPGYQPFAFPCADAFVTELGHGGTSMRYSTYLGGALGDGADNIAADGTGNAYVVGSTRSRNFPLAHAVDAGFGGGSDAFVARISG